MIGVLVDGVVVHGVDGVVVIETVLDVAEELVVVLLFSEFGLLAMASGELGERETGRCVGLNRC